MSGDAHVRFCERLEVQLLRATHLFIAPTHDDLKKPATMNHSCNPNCGFLDPITFIAIRAIRAGEEIVFDYAFSQTLFAPFVCNCSSKKCRGVVTPDDWKIKAIQRKYGAYFSPYLKRKFLPVNR